MNPNKLLLLLLLFLVFPSYSLAQPDVIERNGNKTSIQKWEINSTGFMGRRFEYLQLSGNSRIGMNIVDIVKEASLNERIVQFVMTSNTAVTFQLLKCNQIQFEFVNQPHGTSALFFDGPWIDYFIATGKRRCLREKNEFFLSAMAMHSSNNSLASVTITSSSKIRTNPPKDSSKRDIIEVDESDNTYLASLKNVISYARSKSKNGSMIMSFDGLIMDRISFSKCGLVPKSIELQRKKVLAVEKDLLDFLDRLSYVFCDYDRNEGRVELNVYCSAECKGTIRFEYHNYSTLDEKLPGTVFTIIFVIIVGVCALCCCRCCKDHVAKKTEMRNREAVGIDNSMGAEGAQWVEKEKKRNNDLRVLDEARQILIDRGQPESFEEDIRIFSDATTSRESIRTANKMTNDGNKSDPIYESTPDRPEIGTEQRSTAAQNKEKEMGSRTTPSKSEAISHVTSPKILDSVRWIVGAESVEFVGVDEVFECIDD